MKKFTDIKSPFLVSSLRAKNIDYIIQDIKESEQNGAEAFLLHIELLNEEHKNIKDIKKIIKSTNKPIMALNYRNGLNFNDEKLVDLLLQAVKIGAKAVDLWADMFDYNSLESLSQSTASFVKAKPKEVAMNSRAIKKQKELIEKVHFLGAEVLMSAHIGVEFTCEQAISLAKEIESRGADIVKIITACNSHNQALKILETAAELKKHLKVPFLYQCTGHHGRLTRLLAPLFGSSMVLCHQKYFEITNPEKPLLSDAKAFYKSMKWRMEN